jgi:malate dehydrogenase
MKIAVIGAGNVGSLTALRLAQDGLPEILLVDIVKGLARGKSLDLEDARFILNSNYRIEGTEDIGKIKGSEIIVITAGLARRPGMAREELIGKNALILKDVSSAIKKLCPQAIVIVVTNPLDLMTYFVLKVTGFSARRVFGMGPGLDAARLANLISRELNIPLSDIEPCVIGSHGEGMLPLGRFTLVKGLPLEEVIAPEKLEDLSRRTLQRGAEIVSLLGSGSAFFAPSAAIAELVRAVIKDEKRIIGVCAYLNGEYGIKDVCIGVPCRLGKEGIENIVQLDLNQEEKIKFASCAESLRSLNQQLPL